MATFDALRAGLQRYRETSLDAGLRGLKGACAGITLEMRATNAHGDVTGATRANYTCYAVGRGETGATEAARAITAVETFNPGHSAQGRVSIGGELGAVVTSFTDYQSYLEIEYAGAHAVLTPTLQANALRFTQGVADGMRRGS